MSASARRLVVIGVGLATARAVHGAFSAVAPSYSGNDPLLPAEHRRQQAALEQPKLLFSSAIANGGLTPPRVLIGIHTLATR